ncbi:MULTISPECIES: hypothetical protein [unclassified Streptomyces]|uniref:hypothetical protein n=1 Tax=unclassified Streptomyces TaxID=2593676 RepID=UPI0006AEFDEE|nr:MULTISPECIES: hypothetical protein [unclassified Streptomyces]
MHSHQTAGDVVAAQIRRHRERLGMNRNDLAAECARLGRPDITYAVIVSIETGRAGGEGKQRRRPVTVDDLLVLGLALATPPLLLMLPLGSESTVPTVPAADPRDPHTVWQWMTGETTPTLDGPIDGRYVPDSRQFAGTGQTWASAWGTAAYPVSLYPELTRRRETAHKARLRAALDPSAQTEYVDRLGELAQVVNDMVRASLTVPDLPPELTEDMKRLELLDHPDQINRRERE